MTDIISIGILLVTSFVSHFFAAFSGGSALIILPALFFVGLGPTIAVATNRAAITVSSVFTMPFVAGKLNLGKKIPALLIGAQTLGGIIGALILISLAQELLFFLISLILIFGGLVSFFSHKGHTMLEKKQIKKKSLILATVLLFFIGVYRGFFGPAAGTFDRLVLINFLDFSYIQALAIAPYMAFISSVIPTILFIQAGLVDFYFGFIVAIGMIFGGVLGIKTAISKGNELVSKVFGILAILIGLSLIFFR